MNVWALVARLARRGAEPLARFILTLAHDDNGVGAYVRRFVTGEDLPRCLQGLEESLVAICDGERSYDRRHALDDVWLRRLEHLLDVIELVVLPADPRAAVGLLVKVIESDEKIENLLGDAWTTPTFERACALLRQTSHGLPATEVEATFARLLEKDGFGHRARLRSDHGKPGTGQS